MMTRVDKLRGLLAELEAELDNVATLDEASRNRLRAASHEIAQALERTEPAPSPPHSIQERLTDTVESFEVAHPAIAGVVRRLVDGLAQLGI